MAHRLNCELEHSNFPFLLTWLMESWNILAMWGDHYFTGSYSSPMSMWQGCWSQVHLANSTVLVPGSIEMNETEIKMQTLWQMNLRDVTHVNWKFFHCLHVCDNSELEGQSCYSDPFILSNICTRMIKHWLVSILWGDSAQGKYT